MGDTFKTQSKTMVTMTEIVFPNDTNPSGNLMGGRLMHWIDIAGGMVATRHAGMPVVTVAIDSITFKHPIRMGEMVVLNAKLVEVGNSSMKVDVIVTSENMYSGATIVSNEAKITFVAIDSNERPTRVPRLILE